MYFLQLEKNGTLLHSSQILRFLRRFGTSSKTWPRTWWKMLIVSHILTNFPSLSGFEMGIIHSLFHTFHYCKWIFFNIFFYWTIGWNTLTFYIIFFPLSFPVSITDAVASAVFQTMLTVCHRKRPKLCKQLLTRTMGYLWSRSAAPGVRWGLSVALLLLTFVEM